MSKPWIHALSSAKKFGGTPEDYLPLHNLMDSSKSAIADVRHRALTHNSWFLSILERIKFPNSCEPDLEGKMVTIINSDGVRISVRDIGEQHILEDYKNIFIPSPQDFLAEMELKDWMNNGNGKPPSMAKIYKEKKIIKLESDESEVKPESKNEKMLNFFVDGSNTHNRNKNFLD